MKDIIYLSLIYGSYLKDKRRTKISITPFSFRLIRYKDSSLARNFKDKKFVIEYYYSINGTIISWYSKKQKTVSTFTIKATYIILRYVTRETIWLRCFINELQVSKPINHIILYRDNETRIILTKNAESQY